MGGGGTLNALSGKTIYFFKLLVPNVSYELDGLLVI